jgi:hypothetical protein
LIGEENRESIKIVDGKKQKIVKRIEHYSDGTQKVKEISEDDENGKSERIYRLDSHGNHLSLSEEKRESRPIE